MRRVLCGAPKDECSGGKTLMVKHHAVPNHTTHEEAFHCYRKHLLRHGWIQIGGREFSPPGGGPIRVLTKQARFGAPLWRGKEGGRTNFRRKHNRGAVKGGTVVSS